MPDFAVRAAGGARLGGALHCRRAAAAHRLRLAQALALASLAAVTDFAHAAPATLHRCLPRLMRQARPAR
jgi:hypothetical protein